MTYENYPWERMLLKAVQEKLPRVEVTGYQHTVVPEAYLNYFMSADEKKWMPLPDRVLTTGERPKEIMKRCGDYKNIQVEAGCGLRFEYLLKTGPKFQLQREIQNILIPLEASLETYDMIFYALNELKNDSKYKIVIRIHPLLKWEAFEKKFGLNLKDYPNARVSKGTSLKEDLEQSDVVLYWGTTVSLEALMLGKPVIHFDKGNILSFDPLFESNFLKWVVSKQKSLLEVIEEIDRLHPEEYLEKVRKAQEYISMYFHQISPENLRKFLPNSP